MKTKTLLSRFLCSFVCAYVALNGCNEVKHNSSSTYKESVQDLLTHNIEKWDNLDTGTYSFDYQRSCECPPDLTQKVSITVKDQKITSIITSKTHAPVDVKNYKFFKTVKGLYGIIQGAINNKAHSISVKYNIKYGYPENISIDFNPKMVDEEFIVTTGNLQLMK